MREREDTAGMTLGTAHAELLMAAFDQAPLGVALVAVDGRVVRANAALAEVLGRTPQELERMSWQDVVHPDDDAEIAALVAAAVAQEIAYVDTDTRFLTADGGVVRLEVWGRPLLDDGGDVAHFIAYARDVTEQRAHEEDVRVQNEILAALGEGVLVEHLDSHTILYANRAFEEMLGYPAGTLAGRSSDDFVTPWGSGLRHERQAALLREGRWSGELKLLATDGRVVWVQVDATVFDHPRHGLSSVTVHADVTARKREQDLAARLASIVDQSLDAIMAFDVDGRVTWWNAAAERIYRRSAADVIGRFPWELPHAGPDTRDRVHALIQDGVSGTFESEQRRGDGTTVPVEASVFPLLDAAGERVGASMIARDITARRAAERDGATLAALVANTQVAVVATDREDVVTAWNPAAERMFGWTAEQMVGQRYERLVPEEERAEVAAFAVRAAGGERLAYERRRLRRDGSPIDVAISVAPIVAPGGQVIGVASILQDVTDRRRAEQVVAEERARLRSILRHTPSIVYLKDVHGRLVLVNDHFCEFYGRTEAELLGRTDVESFPGELGERMRALDQEVLATGHIVQANEEVLGDDGDVRTFLSVQFPVYGPDGGLQGVGGFATDVTELKTGERARAQLAAIVEASNDAIMGIATDGTMLTWNAGAERLLGHTAAERVGRRMADYLPPERVDELMALMRSVLDGEVMSGLRMAVTHADGHKIPVSVSAAPLRDEQGVAYGVSVTVRDVSALVEAERELDARARELARSNADLEAFAYAASHDLQEPLRVIALATEVVQAGEGEARSADSQEMLDLILASARRMSAQIDALLAVARIGQVGAPDAPVSADDALDAALDALRVSIAESGATIAREPLGDLLVDRSQLVTLLQNLVSNAIKFAKPGEPPQITVLARRSEELVELEIADHGIGIEPHDHERIFRVFQRGGDHSAPGVGIGLALVRTIVERHGGSLRVDSTPGEGATFVLSFPTA